MRSPITGGISPLLVSEGTKAANGAKLFSAADPSPLGIYAEFSAQDLTYLKIGTEGIFKTPNTNDDELKVNIKGVSPLVDPRTGTGSAELELSADSKNKAIIGTIGQVVLEISLGQVFLIPETALSYNEGKPL